MPDKKTDKKTKSLYQKLLECQKEFGAIEKSKENPYYKSKYADINDYLKTIKPVLNQKGILLLQPLNGNSLRTLLVDTETGGGIIESSVTLPVNDDPQKQGSIITYFRRFALQSLFALEAEDDDGNKAVEEEEKPKFQYSKKGMATYKQKKWIADIWNMDIDDEKIQNLTFEDARKVIDEFVKSQRKDTPTDKANEELQLAKDDEDTVDTEEIPF